MSDGVIIYLLSGLAFAIASYGAYILIGEYSQAASEFRDSQLSSGDTSLSELYIGISPGTLFILQSVVALIVLVLLAPLMGPIWSMVLAGGSFFLPRLYLGRLKEKRVRQIEAQLVDALELLGNSLKSGLTMPQAVELVVKEFPPPIKQEFALVLAESRLGVEFTDALRNMGERLKSNIVQVLATGVMVTKRCGGDLTIIFANISQTIRELATIEGKLNAVTAQGRFQGLILGMMPFALIILLYFVDRSHVETLFGYELGRWAVGLVIVMVGMAQLWIRKLLQIDV